MNLIKSIKTCFSKYKTFSGRASRSEFWWFLFFGLIINSFATAIDILIFNFSFSEYGVTFVIFNIIYLLPQLSVAVRRLHDINKSGKWYLIILTGIGTIFLFYWFTRKSINENNKYEIK